MAPGTYLPVLFRPYGEGLLVNDETTKDWWAPFRVGLFNDPKHRGNLGQAIWLYGYLHLHADRQTGRLVRNCGAIAAEIGAEVKTVQRWMRSLEKNNYVQLRRLPYGYSIQILKFRSINKEKRSDIPDTEIGHFGDRDRTFRDTSDKNVDRETITELKPKSTRPDKNGKSKERLKESNKESQLFSFGQDEALAKEMYQMILKISPNHKKPNFLKWAKDIQLMQTRDGRTLAEIKDLFAYANNHSFWRSNILSPAKLREKFDRLSIEKTSNGNGYRSQAEINSASQGRVVV
jgi:hypothetical protein